MTDNSKTKNDDVRKALANALTKAGVKHSNKDALAAASYLKSEPTKASRLIASMNKEIDKGSSNTANAEENAQKQEQSKTTQREATKNRNKWNLQKINFGKLTGNFFAISFSLSLVVIGGYFLIKFYVNHILLGMLGLVIGMSIGCLKGETNGERFFIGIFMSIVSLVLLMFISFDTGPPCFPPGRYCE